MHAAQPYEDPIEDGDSRPTIALIELNCGELKCAERHND